MTTVSNIIENGKPDTFKVKLNRGTTGGYGFELTIYGAEDEDHGKMLLDKAIDTVAHGIEQLDKKVPVPEKPAKAGKEKPEKE